MRENDSLKSQSMPRKVVTSGTCWVEKEGKLKRHDSREQTILLATPWEPRPMGYVLRLKKEPVKWRNCRPIIRCKSYTVKCPPDRFVCDKSLLMPEGRTLEDFPSGNIHQDVREAWALRRFFEHIPVDAQLIAARFSNQFDVLSLLKAVGKPAFDLFQSGRQGMALGYAIACLKSFKQIQKPLRAARALFRPGVKRREIVEYLGYPPALATSVLRLMDRIPEGGHLYTGLLLKLREAARLGSKEERVRKLLLHLPRVTWASLALLSPDILDYATPQLLADVAHRREEDRFPETAMNLGDMTHVAKTMCPDLSFPSPRPLKSAAAVRNAYRAFGEWWQQQDLLARLKSIKLPAPPFPETAFEIDGFSIRLIPQTDPETLLALGSRLENCLRRGEFQNLARCREGKPESYIYAVRLSVNGGKEEEFCLEVRMVIRPDKQGLYRCKEIRARQNGDVPTEAAEAVKKAVAFAQSPNATLNLPEEDG